MDAGRFDRKITLQRKVETDTGYGTEETGWTDIATVSAQLVLVTRAVLERMAAGEINSSGYNQFRIRRDSSWSDLNATDRLLYNGNPHDITYVREEGRRFFLIDAMARGDA